MIRWGIASLCAFAIGACGDDVRVDHPSDGGNPQPPAVMIEAPADVNVVEGATETFSVTLLDDPQREVTIAIASLDSGIVGVTPTSITLTSDTYRTGAKITLVGIEDDDDVINDATQIELSIDGETAQRIATTAIDNDVQQIALSTS